MRLSCAFGLLFVCSATNAQLNDSVRHERLQEVVVTSQAVDRQINKVDIGTEKINVDALSQMPAMLGERDIIKGLQLLPGVKSEGDGLGGYQVRGGTSSQNQILLDGAPVYNVGHMLGLFSAFNSDAIGSAELFKGLMPPYYGGGSSSVLNMTTRSGDAERNHLSLSVGLLSAKLALDGPLNSKGARYMVAGRTSYMNLFIKSIEKYQNNSLSFYDVNARLNFRLGDQNQLSFSLFRGYDNISVDKMLHLSWSNTTASLGLLHNANSNRYSLTHLVASSYDSDQGMDVYSYNLSMKGFNRQVTLRHQQVWTPDGHHQIHVGGEGTLMGVQSAAWRVVARNEKERNTGWLFALWASDEMQLLDERLQLSAGLRFERIFNTYNSLQPRASLNWHVSPLVSLKAGYSRLVQTVQPIRTSSMTMPIDRLLMASKNIHPMTADQIAVGASMMTPKGDWDFSADVYWKTLNHVYDYREGKTFNTEIELETLVVGGRGRAYGLELGVHKNTGRTTGWVAYTLSWVQNQIEGIMNGAWYTAPNDRRHDFVVAVMSRLSPRWTLSSSWRYTSGQAMTAPSGKYEIDGETHYYFGDRNVNRAPAYHRLDLSVSRSVKKRKGTSTWTFGIFNAYHRYNPFYVSFKEDQSKPTGTKAVVTSLFGFVPTVSYSYKY